MDFNYNSLPDTSKSAIIGAAIAFIGIIVTSVVNLFIVFIKDYCLPQYFDNLKRNRQRIDVYKNYRNPLVESAVNLCFRLKQIIRDNRRTFLLNDSPKNIFNSYQYISTMYRICALIGWIRASKKEWSYYEVSKTEDKYKSINDALFRFENCLADGQDIEHSRIVALGKLFKINITTLLDTQASKVGIAIDDLIQTHCFNNNASLALNLSEQQKFILIKETLEIITRQVGISSIDDDLIQNNIAAAIKELSITEVYIYRDWQSAIGDLMIKPNTGEYRKHDIIGYKEFENICTNGTDEQKLWLRRIERFISNLDMAADIKYDRRIGQIRNLYVACIRIIEEFDSIEEGHSIRPAVFGELKNLAIEIDSSLAAPKKHFLKPAFWP